MRLAFVDDDYGEIKKLTTMIDKELQGTVYSNCKRQLFDNGKTFLSVWKPGMYDIVFLDIFMDQLTGVDVARQIRKTDASVKIIFCTTSNEFASESYCVDASFYLLKPFSQNMVHTMVQKLIKVDSRLSLFITLPNDRKLYLRDIIYGESINHKIFIHTKSHNDISFRMSFGNFLELISPFSFLISCCKGIIVNLYEVINKENNCFILSDNSTIPISRRKIKEINNVYADFIFEKMKDKMLNDEAN